MSRLHKFAHVLVIVVVFAVATFAQTSTRDYRRAHEHQILSEFTRLLGGGLLTQLQDVPLPAGPVRDHPPIYYSLFLREARRADRPVPFPA